MKLEPIGNLVGEVNRTDPAELGRPTITYLDISSVDSGAKRVVAPQRIAAKAAPSRARQLVCADDVLVSTVRPNLNAVAFVPSEYDGEIASTGFCVLRAQPTRLDPQYLFYFSQSAPFVAHLTKIANGASYPAVSDNDIFETCIPYLDLPEQRQIAQRLEQADRLRRTRRYALQLTDSFLPAAFLKLFGDRSCPNMPLEELAKDEQSSFVNGPFGSDLLTSELTTSGVPVIYIRDISSGRYDRTSTAFVTSEKASELQFCSAYPGDVLVTKVGDPPGVAAIYPSTEPNGIITQDVIRIRPNTERALAEYLQGVLNSPMASPAMKRIMIEGTRLRFSLGQFKEILVPVPPLPLQQKFAALVHRTEHLRAAQREALRQADHLFTTLLHQAFRPE
jgi:type I restriction enzyme S subunit